MRYPTNEHDAHIFTTAIMAGVVGFMFWTVSQLVTAVLLPSPPPSPAPCECYGEGVEGER